MKFTDRSATRSLWVLAQDPSIVDRNGAPLMTQIDVVNESLAFGPKGARLHVVDYNSTTDRTLAARKDNLQADIVDETLLRLKTEKGGRELTKAEKRKALLSLIDDPHFHAQNVYGLVSATLLEFERALGRSVNWGFASDGHQLKIAPHAFADANAFYSREDEALAFGYFPMGPNSRKIVFTCLSHDVVVHEATHALLDGLRSEYMRPSSVDQAAFHEGFSDIVALLSAFKSEGLIDLALGEGPGKGAGKELVKSASLTPERLRQSALIGLAEEFGKALAYDLVAGQRGDALRRSAELAPGEDLYNDADWRAEPHDFGEVLVAPVMNAFIEIWARRSAKLDPVKSGFVDRSRAIEDGAKAASHLLRMSIRALDYLPPLNMTFPDYLSALVTADAEIEPDDSYGYRKALIQSFAGYGIAPASRSQTDGCWEKPRNEDKIVYGFSGHAEMSHDRESVFRFLWENRKPLELHEQAYTKIISVRPVRREGPNGRILRETVAEYMQLMDIRAGELKFLNIPKPRGLSNDANIRLLGGGTLLFNDYGKLKFHVATGVASRKQKARLEANETFGQDDERGARRFVSLHLRRAMSARRRATNGGA